MAPMPTEDEADANYGVQPGHHNNITSANASSGSSASAPFVVRYQEGDGNCLFRSFSDQMYGTPDHHGLVRERCSRYLASERNYFQQFVAEPFDEFLARIRRFGEWGDDVEIQALSEMYDCRVEIYASYNSACHSKLRTFHEACEAKWPQPIRLQYEGQRHYNSLALQGCFVPICRSSFGRQSLLPGEVEDAALLRSAHRQQQAAGLRRKGAIEADTEQTDKEVLDESVRLSRLEFDHKSEVEMDRALADSRTEWERSERKRMDKEVVDAILQQSVLEEEQKQLTMAVKESKATVASNTPGYGSLYNFGVFQQDVPAGASSSSANERDSREFQYPESVYNVMSMGFPLEKCIQAYHLVGDNPEGILAFCCQTIGR